MRVRVKKTAILERCDLKQDVVTKIDRMLKWISHMDRMNESLSDERDIQIQPGRQHWKRTVTKKVYHIISRPFIKKAGIHSEKNKSACMEIFINVSERLVIIVQSGDR